MSSTQKEGAFPLACFIFASWCSWFSITLLLIFFWTSHNNGCCFIISVIILHGYIIIVCLLSRFYPKKTATYGHFFGCSMYGNVFLVRCFTKHRPPTVVLSFSLSKNVTYIFFESTIASFYQSLCCGSPRGTMKICAMELDLQNSRILLPINCFPLSLYARSLEIQTWKYILQRLYNLLARMFWTLMGWAKNVFCSGRWCEVPESICLIKPSYPLSMHYCITKKLDYCNSLLYGLPTIFTLINFKEFKMLLPDL